MGQTPFFKCSTKFLVNMLVYKYCFKLPQEYAKHTSTNFSVTEYSQHIQHTFTLLQMNTLREHSLPYKVESSGYNVDCKYSIHKFGV
jgi:hypothetical protein